MPEKVTIIYHEIGNENNYMLEPGMPTEIDTICDTVSSVKNALTELGYLVDLLEIQPPVSLAEELISSLDTDIVFNLFEGFDNWPESEAAIANYMERMQICFTGCPSEALRNCENKAVVKNILRANDIPTPEGQVFHPCRPYDYNFDFPRIVKPLGEHASYGLTEKSVVWNHAELRRQVEYVWQTFQRISLVEEFLTGREFRVLVTGNKDLNIYPVEEIIYSLPPGKPHLLTYAAKWIRGDEYFKGTREQCPPVVDDELKARIDCLAMKAYHALGCRNYASIDLRLNDEGQVMVIDINPNTDISMGGGTRYPLEVQNMDYTSFIDEIIRLAKEAHRNSLTVTVEEAV